MTKAAIGFVATVIIGCFGVPILLLSALMGGPAGCGPTATSVAHTSGQPLRVGRWNAAQLEMAAIIIDVGVSQGVPHWGWIIALATAMQESRLRNLPLLGDRKDHDSIGVFQQRPSQGWGTVEQLAKPEYQAGRFFDKLATIPSWQTMPLAKAAQAVQTSPFPDAYAKWTDDAITVVQQLTSTMADCAADAFAVLPAGFNLPANTAPQAVTAILWAVRQLGTPYHFGGSCTDPHADDPDKQCDCSSLMQVAYRTAGVVIPRGTTEQAHVGIAVTDPGQLLPGDLVFIAGSLGSTTHPRHVGMFIGQGLIIQAPKTGDLVKITKLSTWRSQIAAMRRVVK